MNITIPYFELPFFTNLLILLVLARLLGEIFEKFKQPAMIGEIIAGIILGPTLLNIIHRTEEVKTISELGVFLLVIIVGLEIDFDDILHSIKGKRIIISIMAFFIPLLSGFTVGYFFGLETMTTVFIGLCVAITALPVSIRILMDLGKINSEIGQRIISIAIFDDVLALTILGLILNVKESDMSMISVITVSTISFLKLVFFIIVLIIAYKIIKKVTRKENYLEMKLNSLLKILKGKESLYALFFVFILFFATITESLGFHFIIGAFFASMLISKELVGKEHLESFHKTTNSLAMGFLAPIFFAGIGLEFDFHSIQNFWLFIAILFVSYFSKILGGFIGSKISGLNNKISLTMGVGLNARGIMELVIANIAFKAGLINLEIFSILVIMGIVTTLSTPIMLKKCFEFIERDKTVKVFDK
jgi:Kef-type K+ transport system membrane component KefB